MENPNPTVFEYSGEATEGEDDEGGGEGGRMYDYDDGDGDLLSVIFSKDSNTRGVSYTRPDIFYFPLFREEEERTKRRAQDGGNGENGRESGKEEEVRRGLPSNSVTVYQRRMSSFRPPPATKSLSATISAAMAGRGSLGRRRQDLKQQGEDFLELLRKQMQVECYMEEWGDVRRRRMMRGVQRRGVCTASSHLQDDKNRHIEGRGAVSNQLYQCEEDVEVQRVTEDWKEDKSYVEGDAVKEREKMGGSSRRGLQDVRRAFCLERRRRKTDLREKISFEDPISAEELYSYIRHIQDPEHPYSLEQLDVVALEHIQLSSLGEVVPALFSPSIVAKQEEEEVGKRREHASLSLDSSDTCESKRSSDCSGFSSSLGEGEKVTTTVCCGTDADTTDNKTSFSSSSRQEGYASESHSSLEPVQGLPSDVRHKQRGGESGDEDGTTAATSMDSDFLQTLSSSSGEEEEEDSVETDIIKKEVGIQNEVIEIERRSRGLCNRQVIRREGRISADVKEMSKTLNESEELTATEIAYRAGKGRHMLLDVPFKPTIPHCSQATLIGLLVLAKLMRSVPLWMKAEVRIIEGKHISFKTINKQLKDKERVSAAIENPALFKVINRGLAETDAWMDITDLLLPFE
ncbi:loc496282 related [Cystoisospora suis]|uniref:Loc496282 related n=1 Tax=Cystoisospora suis TaxID=483139 RepID=A0A2C6K4Y9_9APIC|nr:loc496282 related [Cystoisospora suis]